MVILGEGVGVGSRSCFTGEVLTIPCVISHLSMGSMSEFPPLPLLCVENRKVHKERNHSNTRDKYKQQQVESFTYTDTHTRIPLCCLTAVSMEGQSSPRALCFLQTVH